MGRRAGQRKRTWKRKAKELQKRYADALERGWRVERDYLQKVCNEYHSLISWRLADHEEPELPLPIYDAFAPPVEESLSEEEQTSRNLRIDELNKASDRICCWLQYWVRSLHRGVSAKVSWRDNPFAVLLAKLSGLTVPLKARQGWQQYMHELYQTEIAPLVPGRWAADSIKPDGSVRIGQPNAPFRAALARELFDNLPEDRQTAIRLRAKNEAKEAKQKYEKGMKDGPSKSPEARQDCIDKFGRFVVPIMRGLQEATGLQGFLMLGGPIPRFNGELGTIHLSVGTNLASIPTLFPGWDKAYTTEQCAEARLLPVGDPLGGLYKFDPDNNIPSDDDWDTSDDDSDSESLSSSDSDKSGSEDEGGKEKGKGKGKGKARPEDGKSKKKANEKRKHGEEEGGPAPKKLKKTSGPSKTTKTPSPEEEAQREKDREERTAFRIRQEGEREREANQAKNAEILKGLKLNSGGEGGETDEDEDKDDDEDVLMEDAPSGPLSSGPPSSGTGSDAPSPSSSHAGSPSLSRPASALGSQTPSRLSAAFSSALSSALMREKR
ncbi:hypothetical protein DFH06DRAFT_1338742 [Mycena polygramma]|nr:hypothetical protein DFH06DRAFT_1338742 [Mycena polygramma]